MTKKEILDPIIMYYKEEIIHGMPVIMCRKARDGEWILLSLDKLEKEFLKFKVEIERLKHKLEIESRRLHEKI